LHGILRQLGLTIRDLRWEESVKRVSDPAAWPADLVPTEEGGFIVTFPDLPNGWSQGETRDEALAQAEDLRDEMILGRMAHNEDVPRPSPAKGRPIVALPALTAAKVEAYRAMLAAGLNKRQLAKRLGWQPSQVTRLFDGRHASRLDQIEAALQALGRRLVVTSAAG
jgi:antitoxin HicB